MRPFLPLALLGLSVAVSACVAEPAPVLVPPPPPPVAFSQPGQPVPTQQNCREFNTPVTIGEQQQQASGTACLQPDGSWKIEQHVDDQPMQSYVVPPQMYQAYYPPDYLYNPWFYGPPLFTGGLFIGGGWGFVHGHEGWHGAWHGGYRGGWRR